MNDAGYSPTTLGRAKALRRDMTDAERKLWSLLRAKRFGVFKVRRQQPIGPYIADFVCQAERLVIEADGSQHAESVHDVQRSAWLGAHGYRVLRFWNNEILQQPHAVANTIFAALTTPSPSHAEDGAGPSLSLQGRGAESACHG